MAKPIMEPADFARLRKLLALTTSDADGEALTAIRMANAVLTRTKVHWFDLLDTMERGHAPAPPPPRRTAADEINAAFDLVLCTARGKFRDFILSLLEQWQIKGTLSPKQRQALMAAAQRARGFE